MSFGGQRDPTGYDLFVSYAGEDNQPMQGSGPWVSQFVKRLQSTLELRMGTAPRVWFDWVPGEGLSREAQHALQSSAFLIPILSPAYMRSERCLDELHDFVEAAGPERVLTVVKAPTDVPLSLRASPVYQFFRSTADGHQELVDQPYYAVLNQMASQVRFLLTSVGKANPAVAPRQAKMEVFLCHSSGDKAAVRRLWERLKADGFAPWLDEKELLPGQRWEVEIQNAINRAGAIVVCLSRGSVNKEGYLQREIRLVLDKAAEMPEDVIFLIPGGWRNVRCRGG